MAFYIKSQGVVVVLIVYDCSLKHLSEADSFLKVILFYLFIYFKLY